MTPAELVKLFRREVDDQASPYLWKDDDVYHYLDVAQRDFARLTHIFSDATNAEVCSVSVLANEKFVDLSPLIIIIRRAKLLSGTRKMTVTSLDKVEFECTGDDYNLFSGGNWESKTGTPKLLLTDVEKDKGRLVPIPTADDTLELMVYRYPLNTVTSASTELEVTDPEHQRILLLGMKAAAYDTHDADVRNETVAADYRTRFEAKCRDVKWELVRKRDKQWTTRSAWI